MKQRHLLAASLSALAVLGLWACSDPIVGAGASLDWSPRAYNFPETQVGSNITADFTLKNNGSRTVRVSKVSLATGSAASYTIVSGAVSSPRDLAARAELRITVKYAPTSLGEARATLRAESDAGATPIDAVLTNQPPAPRILLEPAALDFGVVDVGQAVTRDLTIRNVGTAPLTVARAALSSLTSREFSLDLNGVTLPVTLDILQERKVKVTYRPSAAGMRSGALEVMSDDPRTPIAREPLSTGETAPGLSVDPLSLVFGPVEQGRTRALQVLLTNTGTATLLVTPSLTGSLDFSFPTTQVSIAANATVPLEVTYAPSDAGTDAGTLVLTHNDPAQGPVNISLSGGAEPSLELSPLGVQFTNVVQFQSSEVEVVLTNGGYGVLTLGSIAFGTGANESNPDFTLRNLPTTATNLARGQSARFTVRYTKSNVGNPTAIVYIASNDPDPSKNPFPLYLLAKDGVADAPPVAVIACASCNGTTQQGSLPATVRLDGSASNDPGGQPIEFSWALLAIPTGSQAVLDSSNIVAPRFAADVAGTYRVGLVVQDSSGQLSPRVTRDLTLLP